MDIEVSFGVVSWPKSYGDNNKYTCTVESAEITKQGTSIAITGDHQEGKTNADVEALLITNCVVKFFPRGINEIFPNLKFLSIRNCGLESISRDDLAGLEGLERLDIWGNPLQSLPDDLLMSMRALRELSFYDNKIDRINPRFLEPVKETLGYANIIGNPGSLYSIYFDREKTSTSVELMMKTMKTINERDELNQKLKESDRQLKKKDEELAQKDRLLADKYRLLGKKDRLLAEKDRMLVETTRKLETSSRLSEMAVQKLADKDRLLAVTLNKTETFSGIFEKLRTSGTFADLIVLRGNEVRGHKCILAAQSSVFAEIFNLEDTANLETIKREVDFSDEVFDDFFQFFYTQVIKNEDHAKNLLELALEYDVPNLKAHCEDLIVGKILNEENALEIYNFAHQKSSEKLKRPAFDIIKQVHPEVPEYLYNTPEGVNVIIEAKLKYEQQHPTQAKKPRLGDE